MAGWGCSDPSASAPDDPPQQVVQGAFRIRRTGLEVRAVAMIGRDPLIEDAPPPDTPVATALRRCGLRCAVISAEDAAALVTRAERTSGIGGGSSNWVSPGLAWTEVAREPGNPDWRAVALDQSVLQAPPGEIRLLARCWAEPVAVTTERSRSIGTLIRLQFTPQILEAVIEPGAGIPTRDRLTAEADKGQRLSRLGLETTLRPGQALVITYEGPDDPGGGGVQPPPDARSTPGSVIRAGETPPQSRPDTTTAGPSVGIPSRVPRLGQVLLTVPAPGSAASGEPKLLRRVLILLPRFTDSSGILPEP